MIDDNNEELKKLIEGLESELVSSTDKLNALAKKLKMVESFTLLKSHLDKLFLLNEETTLTHRNVIESLRIATHSFQLESKPFNLIEVINDFFAVVYVPGQKNSVLIENDVPEVINGDEERYRHAFNVLARHIVNPLSPNSLIVNFVVSSNDNLTQDLELSLRLLDCERGDAAVANLADPDFYDNKQIFEALLGEVSGQAFATMLVAQKLSIQYSYVSDRTFDLQIRLKVNKTHRLPYLPDRIFLKNKKVLLVDPGERPLTKQLKTWGAELIRFRKSGMASSYLQANKELFDICIIRNEDHMPKIFSGVFDILAELDIPLLIISPKQHRSSASALHIATEDSSSKLANVLAQIVGANIPFPFRYISRDISKSKNDHKKSTLLVTADTEFKSALEQTLPKWMPNIEWVEDSVDACMSSLFSNYDLILVDAACRYISVSGLVEQLQNENGNNSLTPVVVFVENEEAIGECSEISGVHAELTKKSSMETIYDKLSEVLIFATKSEQERNRTQSSLEVNQQSQEEQGYFINKAVLDDLVTDTSKDTCIEMISMFIEESNLLAQDIIKSTENYDFDSLNEHAHSLRSASATFGCEALHKVAIGVEISSQEKRESECIRLAKLLPTVIKQSQSLLENYCNDLSVN